MTRLVLKIPAGDLESPTKDYFIRFRVTATELETLQRAASEDAAELAREFEKRGLHGSAASALASPSEWVRQVALDAATKRLRARGIKVPKGG